MENYESKSLDLVALLQRYAPFLLVFGLFACLVAAVIYGTRKRPYQTPRIGIEALGIRRGLTAVEASYLLDLQPTRIVTEIIYSLLKKRAIWVESTVPSLKLRIMYPFRNRTEASENPLRYYEIDLLEAIKENGALDEEKLADTVLYLRDAIEQKMRGYCRRDTIEYYRDIVTKAWDQVRQAGTSELASKLYDKELLWLFLDPEYQSLTERVFTDKSFEASPFWFWYWYSYLHYHPNPKYKPNVQTPSQSAKPPKIPGSEFADNIATALEKTSNNIVANLERFTNAILPVSVAKASTEPAREGASCVCACAACACACACVSCACACASGGVG